MKIINIVFLLVISLFANKQHINTLEANFIQKVTNPSNKTITYKGKIYIRQPNQMLWIYTTPIIKNVYMVGQQIIMVEPELEQAIFTSLTKEINLIELINNPSKVDKKYKLGYNKDGVIKSISYKDEVDNNILIEFINIKVNGYIKNSIFFTNIPDDYDIIRK
jgi:outer membrane lipoprotein carrier protein